MKKTINSKIGNLHTETISKEERQRREVERYNKIPGELKYYDCDKCNNKGNIAYYNAEGYFTTKTCECMEIRKTIQRAEKSGLSGLLSSYTFKKYEATEDWQKEIYEKAKTFVTDDENRWFFIGGQTGAGKSFICTAIVGSLIKSGKSAVYMLWRDDSVKLKANVNKFDVYEEMINRFKTTPVLYIDDFFNVEKGKVPTSADIHLAFELLNYRYNNPDLITIISSEFTLNDIIKIAENVGGRIHERAKNYQFNIAPDIRKNYRLR